MTATSFSQLIRNTNVTTFRAWAQSIHDALTTVGFVQTADTGQINLTTAALPGVGASGGYEIWRFADSLQSTAPIYFRLEYRTGSGGSSVIPQLYLYVGTGTDGAGNLTGTANGLTGAVMTTQCALWADGSIPVNATQTVYVNSADGSGLMMAALNASPATSSQWGFMFVLERTRAWDGTATGDGVIVSWAITGDTNTGFNSRFIPFIVGAPQAPNSSVTGFFVAGVAVSGSSVPHVFTSNILSGSTLNPAPVLTGIGVKVGGPSQLVMAICPGDLPANQSITMSHYGVSRTWRASGVGNRAQASGWGSPGAYQGMNGFIVRVD